MNFKKKRPPAQSLTSWKSRVALSRQLSRDTYEKRECNHLRIKCTRTPNRFERQGFFLQTNPSCGVVVILLKKTAVPATDSFHRITTSEWDELFLQSQEPSFDVGSLENQESGIPPESRRNFLTSVFYWKRLRWFPEECTSSENTQMINLKIIRLFPKWPGEPWIFEGSFFFNSSFLFFQDFSEECTSSECVSRRLTENYLRVSEITRRLFDSFRSYPEPWIIEGLFFSILLSFFKIFPVSVRAPNIHSDD